jgi:hypothetical protein
MCGLYSAENNYVLASGNLQAVKTDSLMTTAIWQKKKIGQTNILFIYQKE